jgi:hypothetical protein
MPAYLKMLRPSILSDYGGSFMCIALTVNHSNFLIFTAVASNIPTVSILLLLTHKISLRTKPDLTFLISEHQLSNAYSNTFITYRCQPDRWKELIIARLYRAKEEEGRELDYTGSWSSNPEQNLETGTVLHDVNLKEDEKKKNLKKK